MVLQPTTNRRLATPPLPRWQFRPLVQTPRKRSVGLLGGSFNPAHEGHRQLSLEALRLLALDEVWWLVSPQNPLKPKAGMAPFEERFAWAKIVSDHPQIRISDAERRLKTTYSVDTLKRLTTCKETAFVFLIGADNLLQLPKWRHWRQIVMRVPIAVFHRHPYSIEAVSSPAAQALGPFRLPSERAALLKGLQAPVWSFLHMRPHPASSTAIRHHQQNWWERNG